MKRIIGVTGTFLCCTAAQLLAGVDGSTRDLAPVAVNGKVVERRISDSFAHTREAGGADARGITRLETTEIQVAEAKDGSKSTTRPVPVVRFAMPDGLALGQQEATGVDTFGEAIVNQTEGLPAWTQRDVDGLRAAIAAARQRYADMVGAGADSREAAALLGNYLGQAIVRDIPVDDLVVLSQLGPADFHAADAAQVVSPASAMLHFIQNYEGQREALATLQEREFAPRAFYGTVAQLSETLGIPLYLPAVQSPAGDKGLQPSTCYTRQTFNVGIAPLSGATVIWDRTGTDDAYADVQLPFPFRFYECDDDDRNTTVRISTNGYVSFPEQGGNAIIGAAWNNEPIPTHTADRPDGMIAGWWDDLQIEPNQGLPDQVSWKVEGQWPQRVFTAEWSSVSRRGGDAGDYHWFQIKLLEDGDNIELHYGGDSSLWVPDSIDSASSGIESYDGNSGDCGLLCGNTSSLTPLADIRFIAVANDTCLNAKPLTVDAVHYSNLTYATSEGNPGCFSGSNRDRWYSFTAPCNGELLVTTCGTHDNYYSGGPVDSGMDTVLSIHAFCPPSGQNLLACNDDDATGSCVGDQGILRDARVSLQMPQGQVVMVRASYNGAFANGAFRLRTTFTPSASTVVNDECPDAIQIAPQGDVTGNLSCALFEDNDGGCFEGNRDVWYRFVAPRAGIVRLTTCGTHDSGGEDEGMDSVVSVFSNCPAAGGIQLGCNDDAMSIDPCNGLDNGILFDSELEQSVQENEDIYIRVSNFTGNISTGHFDMQLAFITPGDMNCNGVVNVADIAGFVLAITNPAGYEAAYPNCQILNADMNGNRVVNVADIGAFVAALTAN